jgi:tetratricopeptide (TPR) repeat protein
VIARQSKSFFLRAACWQIYISLAICLCFDIRAETVPARALFQQGTNAYLKGDFEQATLCFRGAAIAAPSPGAWRNLGNAEWQSARPGPAILAWERASWLNPFDANTRENLRFARKARQLDPPELAWYETCSTWLPASVWPWIASVSFWLALSMLMLPGIFRRRKKEWHQGIAAAGFAIFLLTLPALAGVQTRSKLGVLLSDATPLRLTPTSEAQVLGKLPPGETARIERERGKYIYIHSGGAAGWVERADFRLISRAD